MNTRAQNLKKRTKNEGLGVIMNEILSGNLSGNFDYRKKYQR